jgi:hypothetical protein
MAGLRDPDGSFICSLSRVARVRATAAGDDF